MTDEKQPTLLSDILRIPLYLLDYLGSMAIAIFTDVTSTSVAITAVALGLVTYSVTVGVAVLFGLHVLIRIANSSGEATVVAGRSQARSTQILAQTVHLLAEAITPPPPPDKTMDGSGVDYDG